MNTITNNPAASTAHVSAPPPPALVAETPRSVTSFDEIVVEGKLKPFVELTKAFAPPVLVEQVSLFAEELNVLRTVLLTAASCKKPDQKAFGELLTPLQGAIEAVTRAKEAARKERDWFNHLTVVSEGAPCVGWVTIEPKPGPYINDMKDSTMFYVNRVLKEFKEKDARHADWVRGYVAILDEMKRYVMEYHTTGLTWNANGVSVSEFKAQSSVSAAGAGAPPPPPPPPPPPVGIAPASAAAPAPKAGGVEAVFAEINRGESVTKGLRKVDKSEMTHKNPELRASSVVPPKSPSPGKAKPPARPVKPQALKAQKPPKCALEGNKWMIEYQENVPSLDISDTEISHTVNLFQCKNTTVIVKGKVNAVTLVNCTKTSVLVESVISSISITKSPSFALQITGAAPTIQVDSTDSGQVYLSKACLNTEIVTAKCSSLNISIPVEGEEEGIFKEQPVPEMLKTVIKDGKLVTTVVEHAG